MTRPKTTAAILAALRAMPNGGTRADIAQALGDKTPAASTDWITAALKRLAHAGHIRRTVVHREGLTRPLIMWVATEPVVERRIVSEEETLPELRRYQRDLIARGFVGVAPMDDGRWLCGNLRPLTASELAGLARGTTRASELMA